MLLPPVNVLKQNTEYIFRIFNIKSDQTCYYRCNRVTVCGKGFNHSYSDICMWCGWLLLRSNKTYLCIFVVVLYFQSVAGGCGNIRHTLHRHFCNRWKTSKKASVAKFWHTFHKASALSLGNTKMNMFHYPILIPSLGFKPTGFQNCFDWKRKLRHVCHFFTTRPNTSWPWPQPLNLSLYINTDIALQRLEKEVFFIHSINFRRVGLSNFKAKRKKSICLSIHERCVL